MNQIEKELELFDRLAQDTQSRYPKAKRLPEFLDLLSRLAEQRKAELREIERFVSNINNPLVREIAAYRLLEGLTYEEIAALIRYSSGYVQRLWKPYREQFNGRTQ